MLYKLAYACLISPRLFSISSLHPNTAIFRKKAAILPSFMGEQIQLIILPEAEAKHAGI